MLGNPVPMMKEAYQLLHDGLLALSDAEMNGIRIDVEYCEKQKRKLTKRIDLYTKKLYETRLGQAWKEVCKKEINFNSDTQLRDVLFTKLGIKSKKKTNKENYATDAETLSGINVEGVDLLIKRRKASKNITYLDGLLREQTYGIMHPMFSLTIAITYRSSSQFINFQNLPNRDLESMNLIRGAIYPLKGFQNLGVDYSGIEVATGCFYHKDPTMIKYVTDPTTDMHKDMAIQLYKLKSLNKKHKGTVQNPGEKNLRQGAKNSFVFPQFYGDYYVHCAEGLWKWAKDVVLEDGTPMKEHLKANKIGTMDSFTEHVREVENDFWGSRFKVYNQWKESWWESYQEKGYFDMLTGFRCQGLMNRKQVCNAPIQGTAFHLLLWSFIEMNKRLKENCMKTCMMGQIHDEMLMHVWPEEKEEVFKMCRQIMTLDIRKQFSWINVPLDIEADLTDVDESWNKKKGVKI